MVQRAILVRWFLADQIPQITMNVSDDVPVEVAADGVVAVSEAVWEAARSRIQQQTGGLNVTAANGEDIGLDFILFPGIALEDDGRPHTGFVIRA